MDPLIWLPQRLVFYDTATSTYRIMLSSSVLGLSLLALATTALGQGMQFCYPSPGTNITAGQPFTISLNEAVGLTGWTEIGLAIAMRSCPSGNCEPASLDDGIGFAPFLQIDNMFTAAYNIPGGPENCNYYGNVTVTLPAGTAGEVQLGVAHYYIIGASETPGVDVTSILLNVV
ncbi:hypothetical protein CALVIDRAFT_537299 [Calocera viscosa TUFC12733]|uniref:Uncharacterized protein n=1 Tax=Calocera viscosa (strain TUFC12733) TaxID=1330018 RepID=A0A167LWM1_CALVF|nr:hypothetical protein CALVIDRAFT_537299 [Calocera viscosa TUFC12733]